MPIKVKIKGIFSTFFSITNSGKEIPITDIINAKAVPRGTPFSIKADAMGIAPAEHEYNGIPINTDKGTEYQPVFFIKEAIKSSGT